jgi:hypothetical protein
LTAAISRHISLLQQQSPQNLTVIIMITNIMRITMLQVMMMAIMMMMKMRGRTRKLLISLLLLFNTFI